MGAFSFEPLTLPDEAERLRAEVRAFLAREMSVIPAVIRAQSWSGSDPAFSRKLGAQGWLGMTWPRRYGGHERSMLERYVMLEEMLAAGAPVGAHWIADRQSGPLLLRFGSEGQRMEHLPAIARGERFFCIGMSEPDSGSDLAAVRSRAERQADGSYIVNGRKLWTSGAHLAHFMIALLRTSNESRHGGLTQFLVDMKTPGIIVRPIRDLAGHSHFNEVTFDNVRLAPGCVIGAEGQGWAQVTAELAFERSGPERFLSCFRLIAEMLRIAGQNPGERATQAFGRLYAHLATLRRLSLSVAGRLSRGEDPALEAAVVKDLGALFEQDMPQLAHDLFGIAPDAHGVRDYERVLAELTMASPSFSLRGGTREILRGIIARGLGLR